MGELIIEKLPIIITELIYGFLFFTIYNMTRLGNISYESEHELIKIFFIGFVLKKIYNAIPYNTKFDIFFMILGSVVLGYLSARVINSRNFDFILQKLKIYKTTNKYLWNDIVDKEHPTYITLENNKDEQYTYVYGKIELIEEFKEHPQLVLTEYYYKKCLGSEEPQIIDNEKNPTEKLLVNPDDYDLKRISYYTNKYEPCRLEKIFKKIEELRKNNENENIVSNDESVQENENELIQDDENEDIVQGNS